ncbi:carbohydrate sulfotransferase 6-like [Discoglossus pictus]
MLARIGFLFLILVLSIISFCFSYLLHLTVVASTTTNPTPPPVERSVRILIISSWRSGSSFLGEIFNHHPDVFYMFEPGHPVWMKLKNESSELLHFPVRDLIRSLFNCDALPLQYYLPRGGKTLSEIMFFSESKALCVPPACRASIPSEDYDRFTCSKRCGVNSLETIEEACRTHSHMVMKTVRVFDPRILLPLLQDPSLDLKILHLVRDPRAVTASRKYFPLDIDDMIVFRREGWHNQTAPTVTQVMSKVCRSQVAISKMAKATIRPLNERYMLIRHEDLAREPLESVHRILHFSGLNFTSEIESLVYNLTHKETPDAGGFMSYYRNAKNVTQKWRSDLGFHTVRQIQIMCQEAMELFGYLPV